MRSVLASEKVAVVIPCLNEATGIAQVIAKFPRAKLLQHGLDLHIYVVDNDSTDDTAKIAEQMGATVIHEQRKGKGNALRTGFQSITRDTDYVVILDGDGTYDPEEILRVIEPLRSDFCDVVIGSRLGGRIQTTAMTKLNRLGNWIFTAAVRLFYRANITDALTGYFAWKKPALDTLEPHIKSPGFAVEMEMITKMARLGHQMTSVPISYHPRSGRSNLRPIKDGLRILSMLLRNLAWRPIQPVHASGNTSHNTFRPRKIVFVSDAIYPYMKGGKEKRLHEITKHLAAMGNDVHIYTMHWWSEPGKVRVESGVHLHAICKFHKMYDGDRRTIKEGIIFGLACLKLWRVNFDVLDVDHMPFFPIFSAWVICRLRGRKLHATWHEALTRREWINYMGRSGIIASIIESVSIKLPHRITTISSHTKELLATAHGRAKRVELVECGIDQSLLKKVAPANVTCDVLYTGRLVKDKNVDKLIAAVGIIKKTHPTLQCIIVGQGVEKSRLQAQVAKLKLQKNITFLKPFPNATDVYAYMKATRVFCSPSAREGFGITTLEALGCDTPVITSNSPHNAARNLVQDGINGSVIPLSPQALADAITYWVYQAQKPDIATQLADYDWHNLAQKQAEVYSL